MVADLLEIKGANPFRVRAYRNAARTIGGLSKSVADLIAESKPLTYFSGIGKDLAEKIKEILATGQLFQLRELEKDLPPGMCSEGSKSIKADMRMN
jgi:DNA polymerase (family 10)